MTYSKTQVRFELASSFFFFFFFFFGWRVGDGGGGWGVCEGGGVSIVNLNE